MWLNANEALARLGSKPQSLYANVSRGRIRAKPDPADSRRSLYSEEDVDRLARERAAAAAPARLRPKRSAGAIRYCRPPSPPSATVASTIAARCREPGRTATLEDVPSCSGADRLVRSRLPRAGCQSETP